LNKSIKIEVETGEPHPAKPVVIAGDSLT